MPHGGQNLLDLTGKTFGRLLVLAKAGNRIKPGGKLGEVVWACRCECGKDVKVPSSKLRRGSTKSCGCFRRDDASRRLTNHRPKPRRGSDNHGWQGDAIKYRAAHARIRAVKGKAVDHPCVDCGEAASEWSYSYGCPREMFEEKRGAYSPDPTRYEARCKSCHTKFDADKAA